LATQEETGRIYNAPRLARVDLLQRLKIVDPALLQPAASRMAQELTSPEFVSVAARDVEIFRTLKTSADPLSPGIISVVQSGSGASMARPGSVFA
jgi:hypothetical protein